MLLSYWRILDNIVLTEFCLSLESGPGTKPAPRSLCGFPAELLRSTITILGMATDNRFLYFYFSLCCTQKGEGPGTIVVPLRAGLKEGKTAPGTTGGTSRTWPVTWRCTCSAGCIPDARTPCFWRHYCSFLSGFCCGKDTRPARHRETGHEPHGSGSLMIVLA